MRILLLGEISYGPTSLMQIRAFERLGHEGIGVNTIQPWKLIGCIKADRRVRMIMAATQLDKVLGDL